MIVNDGSSLQEKKENNRYLVLYLLAEGNILKTFGTFSANNDELAYKKAQSILPKFDDEMKIAMSILDEDWVDWLCDVNETSFPVYRFGEKPKEPQIINI